MRASLIEAADAERRAIERTLHDGVQQDLIALSIRLQLARRLAHDDPDALVELLDEMARDVQDALGRVRALGDRVYPSLLDPLGLPEALGAAGIEVGAADVGRFAPAIEAAVFFLCRDAAPALVRLTRGVGVLAVELEGCNGDLGAARDRVEAAGGTVTAEREGYVSATIPDGGRSAR